MNNVTIKQKVTISKQGNGVKVIGATPNQLDKIVELYGNGLDWQQKNGYATINGLFGIADELIQDLWTGKFNI